MFKRMTAKEAAMLVKDGDCITMTGQVRCAVPELFYRVLAERFAETGTPKNLRYLAATTYVAFNEFAPHQHAGLLSEIIVSHYMGMRSFTPAITNNEVAAYVLPQGILSLNYDAAATKQPGFFSKVGLKTFLDPRVGRGGLNEISTKTFCKPCVVNGEEYLFYQTLYPDVCVVRGTTCDPHGNITMEKEAGVFDALSMAIATHNNGGIVIAQVERFSDKYANPHDVEVPGFLVDVVYEDPDQLMLDNCTYNPLYSGETRVPDEDLPQFVDELLADYASKRKPADLVIAKRAALEVTPECKILNLGFGIPMMMGMTAYQSGRLTEDMAITLECGVGGGMPYGQIFALVNNPDIFMSQSSMFRLYDGGAIDLTGVGALEIDKDGNVNCVRKDDNLIGIGGFNHTTSGAKTILVCSRFMVGSDVTVTNGLLIFKDGFANKFCEKVDYINLNAEVMRAENKRILYVTERCVFRMGDEGLELIEIAPGLDLERDVLAKLPFVPKISENLKEMPMNCFIES